MADIHRKWGTQMKLILAGSIALIGLVACPELVVAETFQTVTVNGEINIDQADDNTGASLAQGLKFGHGDTGEGIASQRISAPPIQAQHLGSRWGNNKWGLDFYTNHLVRMSITNGGRIGVGTQSPSRAIEIQSPGDVEIGLMSQDQGRLWTIQSSGGTYTGHLAALNGTFQIIDRTVGKARLIIDNDGIVSVGTLRITGGSDVAEPFEITTHGIPKGAIVSIDTDHPGMLKMSGHAYDTRVAGVVSGANGIEPGVSLRPLGQSGQDVALSGRVYVLADATHEPIEPGDLLTSSDIPGHCMKASDRTRAPGAIIGKAMTPLVSGKGMVLALVSLQ
jgi:hypothetical protein